MGRLPHEASLTKPLERRLPSAESSSADAEGPAGPADIPRLLGMAQEPQAVENLTIVLSLRKHPPSPLGP